MPPSLEPQLHRRLGPLSAWRRPGCNGAGSDEGAYHELGTGRLAVGQLFERAYRRLGWRYPSMLLAVALRLEHLAVLIGVVVLASLSGRHRRPGVLRRPHPTSLQGPTCTARKWLRENEVAATNAWRAAASLPPLLRVWWRGDYPIIAGVESATRETGDDVLITGETHQRLEAENGEWEQRESIPLKGKSESVELYAPARSVIPR